MLKENRKPNRLKHYDYSNTGWYYVTVCTKDHINHFGKIENEKMILNDLGNIADEFWNKIKLLHKNIELDYYVIMPNHVHGIIVVDYDKDAKFASSTNSLLNVGDANLASQERAKMELCKLIQQFKRAVTITIKSTKNKSNFKWQRSFFDRIIRNEKELFNIRKYIKQNPLKWDFEKNIINLDI